MEFSRGDAIVMKPVEYRASAATKLGLLLSLLPKDPDEFRDRLHNFFEARYDRLRFRPAQRPTIGLDELIRLLNQSFAWDVSGALRERALERLESYLSSLAVIVCASGPFAASHNADLDLARFCYAVCRVLSPKIVMETGVAYGITTCFVLRALCENKQGSLLSLDLPPLAPDADLFTGLFVPQDLRRIWTLQRGASRRHLPRLLERLGGIDLFIHDSLHTYANMTWEFQAAWPYLRPGGVLISDDVGDHSAFSDFASKVESSISAIVAEKRKSATFGVLVKAK
jgi:predicted O-methyltransferase YrrM